MGRLRAEDEEARETASTRPAVLLVDDVEANLVLLGAVLEDLDCELVRARSGAEALELLVRREFAVVLLDVQMPDMDGYEVALHAHGNPLARNTPILFVTASGDDQASVLRGYDAGAVDFLPKPVNPRILQSKVQVFLELYRSRREIADAKAALERTNAELRASQAQLVHAAKMASLGELVAGLAHEINNPLAFALSHLDTARRCLPPIEAEATNAGLSASRPHLEKMKDRLGEMHLGLHRIRDLVAKLRTFSRLDGGERGLVNVKECVETAFTILGHRLQNGIATETDIEEPCDLDCYPSLMNQAVLNLVSNAIDAITGEGTITVSFRRLEDRHLIGVSDTGAGIPHAIRSRIFEPFFTTKPVGKGTGLGLSITYSIVQKHGGTLNVDCPATGGTAMTISLPRAAQL